MNYFYDSCAIVEFLQGNERYRRYFVQNEGGTTLHNAMEVFYIVLRTKGLERARYALKGLLPLLVQPTADDVEPAMCFRYKHKEKDLSYTDALGYAVALRKKWRFLTSDGAFKNFENVEFVK